jgi:hypothetical protein
VLAAVAVAAAGCAGDPPAPAAPEPSRSASAESTTAETSQTPDGPDPSGSSDAPGPQGLETPAQRSGRLSRRDFPRPAALGAGWTYVVDPGDTEEGYLGNGTPALARDPGEVVQTAVPFGCPRRAPMPRPTHALEVDYASDGTKVIAIRSRFTDPATAQAFFTGRRANLRACVGIDGGAMGPYVSDLRGYGARVLVNGRTQQSDPWTELAVLDGNAVVLVAAQSRTGDPPLDPGSVPTLARSFRTR